MVSVQTSVSHLSRKSTVVWTKTTRKVVNKRTQQTMGSISTTFKPAYAVPLIAAILHFAKKSRRFEVKCFFF